MSLSFPRPLILRLFLAAACLSAPALSAAQTVVIDPSTCQSLEDPQKRLSCLETLVDLARAAGKEGAAGNESAVGKDSAAEAPATARPAPVSEPRLARDYARPEPEQVTEQPEEFHGAIAEANLYMPNRWHITLENGQVWRQMEGSRYRLREGDEVRIYPSGWGDSYRLSVERLNGFIQVERIR